MKIGALGRLALTMAAFGICCSDAQGQDQDKWTLQDIDAAINAADAAASRVTEENDRASLFLDIADALVSAGATPKSLGFVRRAAIAVHRPDVSKSFSIRDRIIRKLAEFDDVPTAETFIASARMPDIKAELLGKFGAERARVKDITGATRAASEIFQWMQRDRNLDSPNAHRKAAYQLALSAGAAISQIGRYLAASGAPQEAMRLADRLPADGFKTSILLDSAFALCNTEAGPGIDPQTGRELSRELVRMARTDHRVIAVAAEAVAVCEGPEAALSVLAQSSSPRIVADDLLARGEFQLARSFAPRIDPDSADSLLDAAKRAMKEGNDDTARELAVQASRIALKAAPETMQRSSWYDHLSLLGRIFDVLNTLGLYADAIETVQPEDALNRRRYYFAAANAAARRNDTDALPRLVSAAIDAASKPIPDPLALTSLHLLAVELIDTGHRDLAETAFDALKTMQTRLATPEDQRASKSELVDIAELEALLGDLPSAMASAERSGPLTMRSSLLPYVLAAGMATAESDGSWPVRLIETLWAAVRLRLSSPPPALVAGPRARALTLIATAIAKSGDVERALQVEAGLEIEPRDVLQGARDSALLSIAQAQSKSGKFRSALATALRIQTPKMEVDALAQLIAASPR